MALSPLNQRRWRNFKRNRRAYWSLWIFAVLFGVSLFAEFVANDKPIVVNYRGEYFMPIFKFYPETAFGGDFQTEAQYRDPEVRCLIESGGSEYCFDDPEAYFEDAQDGEIEGETIEKGWNVLAGNRVEELATLVNSKEALPQWTPIYGDGHSAEKMAMHIQTLISEGETS
jgi:microcin C transport system permease protein